VRCDPNRLSHAEIERVMRRYAAEILPLVGPDRDIAAPDMATGPREMGWFMDTYSQQVGYSAPGIVTGKPVELGGTAGRLEATGQGVVDCIDWIAAREKMPFGGLRVVIQGLGNVGSVIARELAERGALVVGVADVSGGIVNPGGVDVSSALAWIGEHGFLRDFPGGDAVSRTDVLETPCDLLIPAALECQITDRNASLVDCRIVVEAANGPTTPEADAILADRGIRIIPDVLTNAGGVTVSYFEWVQDRQKFLWDEVEVRNQLRAHMIQAIEAVEQAADRFSVPWRLAAQATALERVADAVRMRSIYP
jgi:glutamate dehydrogenase (NAD(P)+)